MSEITSKDIKTKLFEKFYLRNRHVVDNIFFGQFESDFVFVTEKGYMYEVEIKISKSDYHNDFEKGFYRHKVHGFEYGKSRIKNPGKNDNLEFIKKHDLISAGNTIFKGFYFAMPKELADQIDIPDYCGLIIYRKPSLNPYCPKGKVSISKRAPQLPNSEVINEQRTKQINEAIKWRYINDRKAGK